MHLQGVFWLVEKQKSLQIIKFANVLLNLTVSKSGYQHDTTPLQIFCNQNIKEQFQIWFTFWFSYFLGDFELISKYKSIWIKTIEKE